MYTEYKLASIFVIGGLRHSFLLLALMYCSGSLRKVFDRVVYSSFPLVCFISLYRSVALLHRRVALNDGIKWRCSSKVLNGESLSSGVSHLTLNDGAL